MYQMLSDKVIVSWNARAIYKPNSNGSNIDIVPDRQDTFGGTPNQQTNLHNWLSLRALPLLRKIMTERYIPQDADDTIIIREFCYELRANPKSSYGYLYITAGEFPITHIGTHHNSASNKTENIYECGGIKYVWGASIPIPTIGATGVVTMNKIGPATVYGYQDESYKIAGDDVRLLNLRVKLDKPPKWMKDQNYRDYIDNWKDKERKPQNKTNWLKDFRPVIWGEFFQPT